MALAVLSMSIVAVALTAQKAGAAPLSQTTVITWNMQGEGGNGQPGAKYQQLKEYMLRAPVVLVQEAGSGPPSSLVDTGQSNPRIRSMGMQTADLDTYQFALWMPGTERLQTGPYSVYFLQTDSAGGANQGGRVNIMIVTRHVPDEVRVVHNRVQAGRNALGVRFGNSWYFTFHGLASLRNGGEGGGDSAAMIESIDDTVERWGIQDQRIYEWTVGGDFNVSPETLRTRLDNRDSENQRYPAFIYNTDGPTQRRGGNLDYFVSSERIPGVDTYLYPRVQSDHNPVQVGEIQSPQAPQRVWPSVVSVAGDSIPTGVNSPDGSGFREYVYDTMKAQEGLFRRDVDMVGSQRRGDMGDPDHEGHPGFRIDEISRVLDCSVPAYRPNLMLLMAGTNDLNENYFVDAAPERLGSLVDQIFDDAPETTVLVSTLVPSTKPGLQEKMDRFNAELPRIIEQRRAAGKRVMLVNMGELTTEDVDGSHPNANGYAKMAKAFVAATYLAEHEGWIQNPAQGTGQKCDPDTKAGPGWNPLGVIAPGMSSPEGRTDLVELNGDNRADYIRIGDDGTMRAALNTPGTEPGKPDWVEVQTGLPQGAYNPVRFADLNGDGRDDYLVWHTGGSFTFYANHSIQNNRILWEYRRIIAHPTPDIPLEAIRFADTDGDGRDDFLRVGDKGAVHAYTNIPTDHSTLLRWEEHLNWAPGVSYGSRDKLRLADVNGDRRADYLMVGGSGAVHAYLNNGGRENGGFIEKLHFVNETGYSGDKSVFRDISGDGRADYLVVYDGGSVRAWLNRGGNV